MMPQKCQNKVKPKGDYNLQFQSILIKENFVALKYSTNQPESTADLSYLYPQGLSGPPAVTLNK